jgi:hypothetical protein
LSFGEFFSALVLCLSIFSEKFNERRACLGCAGRQAFLSLCRTAVRYYFSLELVSQKGGSQKKSKTMKNSATAK